MVLAAAPVRIRALATGCRNAPCFHIFCFIPLTVLQLAVFYCTKKIGGENNNMRIETFKHEFKQRNGVMLTDNIMLFRKPLELYDMGG